MGDEVAISWAGSPGFEFTAQGAGSRVKAAIFLGSIARSGAPAAERRGSTLKELKAFHPKATTRSAPVCLSRQQSTHAQPQPATLNCRPSALHSNHAQDDSSHGGVGPQP